MVDYKVMTSLSIQKQKSFLKLQTASKLISLTVHDIRYAIFVKIIFILIKQYVHYKSQLKPNF